MKPIRCCTVIPVVADEDHRKKTPNHKIVQPTSHLALSTEYKWSPGDTIKVRLLGGSLHVQKMVKKYAQVWLKYANLELHFVDHGHADIRVSFKKGGSYSVVGTSCRLLPKDEPTMNFGWFTDKTPEKEFSRTVTHEFGHVLGCIHEHQNPAGNIPWNKAAVYKYYKKTQGWDKERVQTNIFQAYSVDATQFSKFDKKSIMLYAIPAALTKNGYHTKPNTVLSKMDKRFIAEAYPRLDGYDTSDDEDETSDVDSEPEESGSENGWDSGNDDDSEQGSDDDSEQEPDPKKGPESKKSPSPDFSKVLSDMKGKWTGCYYYHDGSTEGKSDFTLDTRMHTSSGTGIDFDGTGSDHIAPFEIRNGGVNYKWEVFFSKVYSGWTWKYFGTYDENRGIIEGMWGKDPGPGLNEINGTFLFTHVN